MLRNQSLTQRDCIYQRRTKFKILRDLELSNSKVKINIFSITVTVARTQVKIIYSKESRPTWQTIHHV